MFTSNLSHWDRKPKYVSKFWTKHGVDGKRWHLTPYPFLAPWSSRPPAIETPPRPVPAGPLISWPKNVSCFRIPPRASRASLPPRRWAMPHHRLSLRPCTAPPSCSLQHLLKLSLLSLRPYLLQSVSIVQPHSPSLRLGLPAPQPSRRHHAQSLLGPSFHDPGMHHVLESHPKQAAPLSRCDDEQCHAIVSHSVLALRLHLAACSSSSSCRFWVLDHLCSNLSQLFHLCWITEIRSLNLCLCFTFSSSVFTFLIEMNFSFKSLFAIGSLSPQRFHYSFFLSIISWQYQKYSTILILVLCLLCVTPLVCSSYSSFAPSSPFFSSWWKKYCELFTHTLVLQCSPSTSSRQPQTTHVFADREDCFYYCS